MFVLFLCTREIEVSYARLVYGPKNTRRAVDCRFEYFNAFNWQRFQVDRSKTELETINDEQGECYGRGSSAGGKTRFLHETVCFGRTVYSSKTWKKTQRKKKRFTTPHGKRTTRQRYSPNFDHTLQRRVIRTRIIAGKKTQSTLTPILMWPVCIFRFVIFVWFSPFFFFFISTQPSQLPGVLQILPEAHRQTRVRVPGLSDQVPQGVSRQGGHRVHQLQDPQHRPVSTGAFWPITGGRGRVYDTLGPGPVHPGWWLPESIFYVNNDRTTDRVIARHQQ